MLRLHSYEDDKNYKTARVTKDKFEIWNQTGAKGEYRTKVGNFALMGGFDIQRNDTDEESYAFVDLYDKKGVLENSAGDLLDQYETKESINALYTEIKHQTTQNLITTLNLRYDDISHEYKDITDNSNNVSPDYETTSYRLGFNYALNNSQEIYTSVSTGFRTPTVEQISKNQQLLDTNASWAVPTSVDVEKTYNYELGIKGKTEGNLAYNASIYQLDRKDYIGKVAGSYVDIVRYRDDEEDAYDNLGDMRSRGFELAINSDSSKTFSYDLAYTYLQAKFTDYFITREINGVDTRVDFSGNYVPRSPKHTINLAMNYKVTNKLTLSPEIYYKGSYFADEANQFEQGGYTVTNLKAEYKHSKSLEFFAKIDNILDKEYYEFVNVTSSTDTATMSDATIRVAAPRAYYAGLRYKF